MLLLAQVEQLTSQAPHNFPVHLAAALLDATRAHTCTRAQNPAEVRNGG